MREIINKIRDNKIVKLLFMLLKAIVTLVIRLIVSMIFGQRVSNTKVTLGGYSIFTIVTESMVPKYEVGDMLLAKKTSFDKIKVGDDLVYIGDEGTFTDKIVTHQVIEIEKEDGSFKYHTKGLANNVEDPIVSEEQVYGVVVTKFNLLSLLSKMVNNVYGFYFLIFIPFVVMIFLEIIDIIHDKDKE